MPAGVFDLIKQQTFFGASVINWNINLGYNSSPTQLNLNLVNDKSNQELPNGANRQDLAGELCQDMILEFRQWLMREERPCTSLEIIFALPRWEHRYGLTTTCLILPMLERVFPLPYKRHTHGMSVVLMGYLQIIR